MKFFDSHAHYFDARFDEYEGGADALLSSLFSENVGAIINVGTNIENSEECVKQAKKYEQMYAAVGIHPEDCLYYDDPGTRLEQLEDVLSGELAKKNKIVALGEIGLDYHIEAISDEDKHKQKYFFEKQMDMAEKYRLPVIIHDREAHGDCFETAIRKKDVTGVFHSYSGSAEMAAELVKRGWYISFSGVVTFKNATRVREVLAGIPLDRLLIETDAPYLAPHPMRGKMNHSGLLEYTAQAFSETLGLPAEKIAEVTAENAKKLFGIG